MTNSMIYESMSYKDLDMAAGWELDRMDDWIYGKGWRAEDSRCMHDTLLLYLFSISG